MNDHLTRRKIRLENYDYSLDGMYFVTICVKDRHEMLGEICVGVGSTHPYVELTGYGKTVEKSIKELPVKYPHVSVNKYTIMPNHIHCIILMEGKASPAPTLGQIIGYLKYQTTKEIGISGFWQRSYHDHIVRNKGEYEKIWQYIDTNPTKWFEDRYYTHA
jgi:REP element-mobilizing transposase RayT